MPFLISLILAVGLAFGVPPAMAQDAVQVGIPIHFSLKESGFVTLVVDDTRGMRVRNLLSEKEFSEGDHTVFWDGLDDLDRDLGAAEYGQYHVPGRW